ncbi:MAG: segregation and condensation protein B [Parcubacteria group bacterium Gr01-1014_70]|nr:MAG: segregation and condensation protein B [Parcubacteria group bacterium Gr01-1014_70]
MTHSQTNLPAIIEALLFVAGESLSFTTLAAYARCSVKEAKEAVASLEKLLATRGIRVLQKDEFISLVSAPMFAPMVEQLIKEEILGELTKAALETLTIIAYRHPITRSDIDYIRGVNSSFTIRNLAQRGLIERLSAEGQRGYRYQPSFEFMKFLGISSYAELPEFETVQKELQQGIDNTPNHES